MAIDLFSIGKFTVHGYGLMIGLGFLIAILYGMWQAKKLSLSDDHLFNLAICVLIFGWLGGKILFCIVEFKTFIKAPLSVLGSEGFVVYGGIISAIITMVIFCRINKIDTLRYIDVIATATTINQGFGRIGCFMAGCCYGRATESSIGVIFPEGCLAPAGVKLLPTQLFSAAADFTLFIILFILLNKKVKKGIVMAAYLMCYAVGRFVIEIFRSDSRGAVGALSTSQFISIFILIGGIIVFWFVSKNKEAVAEAVDEKSNSTDSASAGKE